MKHTDQTWLLGAGVALLIVLVLSALGATRPACLKNEVAVLGWNWQWGCARRGM